MPYYTHTVRNAIGDGYSWVTDYVPWTDEELMMPFDWKQKNYHRFGVDPNTGKPPFGGPLYPGTPTPKPQVEPAPVIAPSPYPSPAPAPPPTPTPTPSPAPSPAPTPTPKEYTPAPTPEQEVPIFQPLYKPGNTTTPQPWTMNTLLSGMNIGYTPPAQGKQQSLDWPDQTDNTWGYPKLKPWGY